MVDYDQLLALQLFKSLYQIPLIKVLYLTSNVKDYMMMNPNSSSPFLFFLAIHVDVCTRK